MAVIAEVKNLVPNKPIKYLINTHHHFDHSGGLRTYVAEGVTIITNEANKAFYEKAWKCAAHAGARQAFAESQEGHVHHVQRQVRTDRREPYARNPSRGKRQPQRIH